MVLNPVVYSNVIVPFYINKFLLAQLYETKTRKGSLSERIVTSAV
jgi:hypothetical protein